MGTDDLTLILRPHRSLSPAGFVALMLLLGGVSFIAGMVFLMMGAWPVFGLFGLDVLLVWIAFRRNYTDARRHEVITLAGSELVLRRFVKDALTDEQHLVRGWTRVDCHHDSERELVGPLRLWFKGRAHEVGSFLGADERLAVAETLRRALAVTRI